MAWQYYVNNTQPNGLANASDGEPWRFSGAWEAISLRPSLHSNSIITTDEFDERIGAALFTLGRYRSMIKGSRPPIIMRTR